MSIELKKNCRYALLVPTSMGIRLTPDGGQPFHCSRRFAMQATSAETNVASGSSYLGLPVKVLTTFVKGSPIARFIRDDLASRHMDCEGREVPQGGPWGGAPQQAGGGGFLKGALGAAAGVAGGVLLADSIRGLFHGSNNPLGIGSGHGAGSQQAGGGDTTINNYYGDDRQQASGDNYSDDNYVSDADFTGDDSDGDDSYDA